MTRGIQRTKVARWLAALALSLASWLVPGGALADGPEPGAPWPQFKRDGSRTGIAAVNGPSNPVGAWSYSTGSAIVSGPIVAADGTIYLGTENFRIWALRPDGTQKWTYVLPESGGIAPPTHPILNSRGRIVFGTQNGYIVGLQTDGKEDWRFDTRNAPYGSSDAQAVRAAPGAAGNYGRLLFGTDAGLLYELEDGAFAGIRRADTDGAIRAGAAVTPDGTVVWGTLGRSLYGGSASGGDKWRVVLDGAVLGTPGVGGDSTTYVGTESGSVYAIATDGRQRWRVRPGVERPIRSSPAIGTNGTIYVGGDEGRLYALDPATGGTRWSFGTGGALTAAPAVGANGLIYLGSNDGRLYVLTPGGQTVAQFQVDGPIDVSSPAIAANGTVYVGTRSGTLYALREGGPAAPPPAGTPTTPAVPTVAAPPGFAFVRCGSGRVWTLGPDRIVGQYVTSPAAIGDGPILQASDAVPEAFIDAICGPGR